MSRIGKEKASRNRWRACSRTLLPNPLSTTDSIKKPRASRRAAAWRQTKLLDSWPRWRGLIFSAGPARSGTVPSAHVPSRTMLRFHALQLTPLVYRQHLAERQMHHCVLPFQLPSRCQHLVDLRAHLLVVWAVLIEQRLQFQILLLHRSLVVNQLHLVVQKNLVE